MKILGISGFENAVPFKKKHWPNLEEREYRISQGHDSAAVLLIDGELIAAALNVNAMLWRTSVQQEKTYWQFSFRRDRLLPF